MKTGKTWLQELLVKSEILLQRASIGDVPLCVCDNRLGTKGDICSNCEGAIPNSTEQIHVDDIISRINRPEKNVVPVPSNYGKGPTNY